MTEENKQPETVEEVTEEKDVAQTEQQPQEEVFTKAEMEEIIKQRVAREKKAAEKAVQEAEKLAKMNQEEKEKYEFEKLKQELDEYKRKDTFYSLSKEAGKMFSEKEIPLEQDADFVMKMAVDEDAESTQERVNALIGVFERVGQRMVTAALSGKAPRVNTGTNTGWTKEKIMQEKDTQKRQKLIADNLELFR